MFAKLICKVFGHKQADNTVTKYTIVTGDTFAGLTSVWQCPRCGAKVTMDKW